MQNLDALVLGYLTTALWSSNDESNESGGYPLDQDTDSREAFEIDDFAKESIEKAVADCNAFREKNADVIAFYDDSTVGHDFWLTRNRHGAGFWDGDYAADHGKQLTDSSHEFGEVNVIIGDDGLLYLE